MSFRSLKISMFAALLTVLGTPLTASADLYRVLSDGPEALQARVDLIQQAQTSIDLSYYEWADDTTARQLLSLLREAAEVRNVKVRVIVDASVNEIPAATRVYLAKSGIVIKNYLRARLFKPRTWFHAMHNKLMVIDGKIMVVGGRNMNGGYFEMPTPTRFHDREAMIQGPAVMDGQKYFDALWKARHVRVRYGKMNGQTVAGAEKRLDEAYESLREHAFLRLNTATNWFEGLAESGPVHFLHDRLSVKKFERPVTDGLYEIAKDAKESVVIEVAYFIITRPMLKLFEDLIRRGVTVRILTNSLKSNDVMFAQAGYMARRKKLVKMGVELHEYMSETTLHVKSAVVDGKIAVIGSYNLDPISDKMNTETVSFVEDETIASELREVMDDNLKSAVKIDRHGHPEGYRRRFPGVPWSRVMKTQLLRYIAVPLFHALF